MEKLHPQTRSSERGSTLAWSALFLMLVFVPFLGLVADGSRLYLVRNKAQTSIDAACEHAAWTAVDREIYQSSGQISYQSNLTVSSAASTIFFQGMSGKPAVLMLPGAVKAVIDPSYQRVVCQASVGVLDFLILNPMSVQIFSASAIRFR